MKPTIVAVLIVAATPSVAHAQTVYSSLPLSGAARVSTKAINTGARLALRQSGNHSVRLVTLNDATRRAGSWVPENVARNARKAAQDPAAIAYIGEFNSGASEIALPILNEAGVPMISPSNTYNGLTVKAAPGEPDKYYPTGARTYFRLLPNDTVQAAALTTAMRDKGCKQIGVLHDSELYGKQLAAGITSTAARLGLKVVVNRRSGRTAPKSLRRADCMAYAGITANGAARLFKTAPKKLKLFGGDGIADRRFAGQLPRSVARRTFITIATLPSTAYHLSGRTDPYQAFGYEAMKLVLDGIAAGATTKAALINWLHGVQNRPSIIGTYGFDANGDTTLRTYGLYSVSGRSLRYVGAITAA